MATRRFKIWYWLKLYFHWTALVCILIISHSNTWNVTLDLVSLLVVIIIKLRQPSNLGFAFLPSKTKENKNSCPLTYLLQVPILCRLQCKLPLDAFRTWFSQEVRETWPELSKESKRVIVWQNLGPLLCENEHCQRWDAEFSLSLSQFFLCVLAPFPLSAPSPGRRQGWWQLSDPLFPSFITRVKEGPLFTPNSTLTCLSGSCVHLSDQSWLGRGDCPSWVTCSSCNQEVG